ncbi:MAG: hypothetical protein R3362_10115, partial [Rhodothermales bacterium]|nr:hypothetical protein [Rhodothermales bacterium]
REGRWRRAHDAYERAATHTADPATRRQLAERQAPPPRGWGEDEAGAARYHAAFDRAAHALDLVGADHPLGRRADALRAEAAEAGTVRVAFLPFWRTDAVGRAISDAFVHDLNDVLVYDYLAAPAAFVAVADPVDVRRSLRRLDLDRRILTDRQAADLGRAGDADLVVVGEVIAFERSERIGKETRRRALLKGRPSTTEGPKEAEWIEQRLTLAFDAEVAYRIVDPRTRRVLDRGTVRAEVVDRLRRGVYAGDYRTLDLDGEALSLFEDAEPQAVEELENALADALASRLAERLYTRLLVQIP